METLDCGDYWDQEEASSLLKGGAFTKESLDVSRRMLVTFRSWASCKCWPWVVVATSVGKATIVLFMKFGKGGH